jgi:hypothetical protein
VVRLEAVRLLLALAAQQNWEVHHMDVKSAFLNGSLVEEVFVMQPPGFVVTGKENQVIRLIKALYCLHQVPQAWNQKLDETLVQLGFLRCPSDLAIYCRREKGSSRMVVGVYVDDLVITGTSRSDIQKFKKEMTDMFKMSDLGLLHYYMGIELHQLSSDLVLSQENYERRSFKKLAWKIVILARCPWNRSSN